MARGPKQPASTGDDTTPGAFPQTTPPPYSPHGHDFTLQCVVELQRTVGEVSVKLDRVIDDVKGHGNHINGINAKINYFLGGAAVVTVVAGITFSILFKVPWDRLGNATPPPAVSVPVSATNATPAKAANPAGQNTSDP